MNKSAVVDSPIIDQLSQTDDALTGADKFPSKVWLLKYPGCIYAHRCIRPKTDAMMGLAAFNSENAALKYTDHIDLSGGMPEEVDYETALGIAISKKPNVNCLLLLGSDPDNPLAVIFI